jgi:S1-C subfamily serine protease
MMLAELPPSPLALLSEPTLIAPPNAINANFSVRAVDDQPRWVCKDVLPGGVAERAGAKVGDVLISSGGEPVPPGF